MLQGSSGSSGAGYDRPEVFTRNPIDDAYPSYVDISPFFEEWTPPRMYTEPGDIQMPDVLNQYNSSKRDIGRVAPRYLTPLNQQPYVDEFTRSNPINTGWVVDNTNEKVPASRMVGHGEDGYPVNYEDSGWLGGLDDMGSAHGNQWKEVYDKDYDADRSFQLYSATDIVQLLSELGMTIIEENNGKLGGVMYFTDTKPVEHCLIYAQKTG